MGMVKIMALTHTKRDTDTYAHTCTTLVQSFFHLLLPVVCLARSRQRLLLLLSDKLSAKLVFELFKLVYFMEF